MNTTVKNDLVSGGVDEKQLLDALEPKQIKIDIAYQGFYAFGAIDALHYLRPYLKQPSPADITQAIADGLKEARKEFADNPDFHQHHANRIHNALEDAIFILRKNPLRTYDDSSCKPYPTIIPPKNLKPSPADETPPKPAMSREELERFVTEALCDYTNKYAVNYDAFGGVVVAALEAAGLLNVKG